MKLWQAGSRETRAGNSNWFTGEVAVQSLVETEPPARTQGALVSFAAGARTAWHTHPLGQSIIITEGQGLVQRWGEAPQSVKAGDVVWFAPGEKHWHGASPTHAMSHIAIHEALDGKAVDWLEKVSDEEYTR